eukprot:4585908-Prymnesium_polylepis.2
MWPDASAVTFGNRAGGEPNGVRAQQRCIGSSPAPTIDTACHLDGGTTIAATNSTLATLRRGAGWGTAITVQIERACVGPLFTDALYDRLHPHN